MNSLKYKKKLFDQNLFCNLRSILTNFITHNLVLYSEYFDLIEKMNLLMLCPNSMKVGPFCVIMFFGTQYLILITQTIFGFPQYLYFHPFF